MHEAWILTKKIYYYKFYLVLGSYHNVFKTFKQKQIQNWPEREGGGGQVKRGVSPPGHVAVLVPSGDGLGAPVAGRHGGDGWQEVACLGTRVRGHLGGS